MKTQSYLFLLLALPFACFAADTKPADSSSDEPSEVLSRDRISSRIMEAYKADPDKPMMAPRTGNKSITDLLPVTTVPVAPDSSEAAKAKEKVVSLPALTVKGRKETATTWEAKKQIYEMDQKIESEKERTVATNLDNILNDESISIMGSADAKAREGDAKRRIHELEVKQSVAACATDPAREEENKKLLKMLQDLEYQKKQH